jgi:pimeloyl-ACP methyl ester carboxylesterase
MPSTRCNGIDLEYQCIEPTGVKNPPTVLLVMGLGMQLTSWPDFFVQPLVGAGFRVVRFDNRDAGKSTQFDHAGASSLVQFSLRRMLRLPTRAPYTLYDMARDAVELLDALDVKQAHWVGVSMGGMIAQCAAIAHPKRVLSLSSIMSSTGHPSLPWPSLKARLALFSKPLGKDEAAKVEHSMHIYKVFAGRGAQLDEDELRIRIRESIRRAYRPRGILRQLQAIAQDTQRRKHLVKVTAPTLVLHGTDDPLVPFVCGQDTAAHIPHSTFYAIKDMGHDLAKNSCASLLEHLIPFLNTHKARL